MSREGTGRIVVVEDDKLLRYSFALYFQTKGFEVVACETAGQALTAIEKGEFDVIISDYGLSGMNGLMLLDRVRATAPEVIRILITGSWDPGIAAEADRCGVDVLLRKPFTPEEMENALYGLFESRRKRAACAS